MNGLLIPAVISVLFFAFFLVLIIYGIIRRNLKAVLWSVACFFMGSLSGIWFMSLLGIRSYHRLSEMFRPRTGIEIYTALFGKPGKNCVEVPEFQDQVIPRLDDAIRLHIRACPGELRRLLEQHPYTGQKLISGALQVSEKLNWFRPLELSDSVLIFTCNKDEYRNAIIIYSAADSTEMFLLDTQD